MVPHKDPHVLISKPLGMFYLLWQKKLCGYDYIKDLEMKKLSQIILAGQL